jgi:hypothetical protein
MNAKIGLTVLLVLLLLLLLVPLVQAQRPSSSAATPAPSIRYVVVPSALSGGNYEFAGQNWQVVGASAGGRYELGLPRPDGALGCCCMGYTPCIKR